MEGITPIGDVVSKVLFEGSTKTEFETLIGKQIIISEVKFLKGEHGKYVVARYKLPDDETDYSTSTGGVAVVDSLEAVYIKAAFPVLAKVVKDKDYYELV